MHIEANVLTSGVICDFGDFGDLRIRRRKKLKFAMRSNELFILHIFAVSFSRGRGKLDSAFFCNCLKIEISINS